MADVGETALSRPSRGLIGAKTHLDLAPHHPPTSSTTSLTHSLTQSTKHPGEKIRPLPDEATIYRPTSITETTSSKSIREAFFLSHPQNLQLNQSSRYRWWKPSVSQTEEMKMVDLDRAWPDLCWWPGLDWWWCAATAAAAAAPSRLSHTRPLSCSAAQPLSRDCACAG